MLIRDQDDAARAYLRGWLERARLASPALVSRFIRATLDASDPETAMKAAQRYGLARVPQSDLERLSDMLTTRNLLAEAETVRSFIRADGLSARPIVRGAGRRSAAASPTTRSRPRTGGMETGTVDPAHGTARGLGRFRLRNRSHQPAPRSDSSPSREPPSGCCEISKAKRTKPRTARSCRRCDSIPAKTSTFQPGSVFGSQ